MFNLKKYQASAITQLNELKGEVNFDMSWREFAGVSREICDYFLALSSASLLCDFKPALFFTNLSRGAENWRRFLMASQLSYQQQASLQYHLPLFAAITANQKSLVDGIRVVLPVNWQKGKGYQSVFHSTWLYTLIFNNQCVVSTEIESHLKILETCEIDENRRLMFTALLGLNELAEPDFWQYFEQMLMVHEESIFTMLDSSAIQVKKFAAQRYIWLEGLAVLRLAKMKGFTLPSKGILFCPDEALVDYTPAYAGDWPLIPLPQANVEEGKV